MRCHELPPGPDPPGVLHAIVEIPSGSRNKYEYDPRTGLFRLDRTLYSSVFYPGDYGFVPGTRAADGDPLDILVRTTEPTFTGCLLEVRPVGMLEMRDEKGHDEKILAVPTADPNFDDITDLDQLPPHTLREIEHFFVIYKELENKPVRTFGWRDRSAAHATIVESIEAFAR